MNTAMVQMMMNGIVGLIIAINAPHNIITLRPIIEIDSFITYLLCEVKHFANFCDCRVEHDEVFRRKVS